MPGERFVFDVRRQHSIATRLGMGSLVSSLVIGSVAPGCTLLHEEFEPTLSSGRTAVADAGTEAPRAPPAECSPGIGAGRDGVCPGPIAFLPDAGAASLGDGGAGPSDSTGRCPAGLAEFGAPEPVTGLGLDAQLFGASLSADGLTLYVAAVTGETERIYTATRDGLGTAQFSNAAELTITRSMGRDGTPFISFDGLAIYFFSDRSEGVGSRDLWRARRQNARSPFDPPTELRALNTPDLELSPWLTRDDLTLLFASSRPGGSGGTDIWISTRENSAVDFPAPLNRADLNTSAEEGRAVFTSDALQAIFASDRPGGLGYADLWMASRADAALPFEAARNLGQLNTADADQDVALSSDDRELFFASSRRGTDELWRSTRGCL